MRRDSRTVGKTVGVCERLKSVIMSSIQAAAEYKLHIKDSKNIFFNLFTIDLFVAVALYKDTNYGLHFWL